MFGKKKSDDGEGASKAAAAEASASKRGWFVTVDRDCSFDFAGETYKVSSGRSRLNGPKDVHPRDFAIHVGAALQAAGAVVELED